MMEGQPSTSSDTGGPSSESQKLNRDIALIYEALRAEREAGSDSGESEEDEGPLVEDEGSEYEPEEGEGESGEEGEVYPQSTYSSRTPTRHRSFKEDEEKKHVSEEKDEVGEGAILIQTHDGNVAGSAESCLALNRAYQEVLADSVKRIRLVLSHNRDRQCTLEEEIENEMKQSSSSKKSSRPSHQRFNFPYFRDARGMVPPGNSDTLLKKLEYDPYEKQPKQWTEDMSAALVRAVGADGLRRQMQPLMNRKELEVEKLGLAASPEERREIVQRIEELDNDIDRVKYLPKNYLYCKVDDEELLDQIDWMKIVAVVFDGEFTEQYLRQVWCNLVHPDIRREAWDQDEDQRLYQLACSNKLCDWAAIAQQLGTNRTAFQCLQRFQTKLSPSLSMGRWLPEEDEVLKELVDNVMVDKYVPWHQVALMMEGRTIEQCEERWKHISQTVKRGRWTTDEDMKLLSAVHCYGKDWIKVQAFVPGRNAVQCRERWINSMAENLRYGNWTYEEDRDLILLVGKYGAKKWSRIAKELTGRTDNMVAQRYRRLLSWQKTNEMLISLPKDTVEKMKLVAAQAPTKKKDKEVVKKVGRLLKQRQTEQRARQIERVNDLTEMDGAEPPVDSEEGVEVREELDATDHDPEQLTHTQLMRKHATELLEKIAKRTYSERRQNWEREQAMIEQDLKEGIYVPRPPDTSATRVFRDVEKRGKMNQAFMECVRDTLKTTEKGDPEQVYQKLARQLAADDLLDEEYHNPSVRTILEAAEKQQAVASDLRHQQNADIEAKLVNLIHESTTTRRTPGRPRKYLSDDVQTSKPATHPRCHQVEKMVTNLMLTTLNVDKIGAQLVAHAVKSTSVEQGGTQRDVTMATGEPLSDAESSMSDSGSVTSSVPESPSSRKRQQKKAAAENQALLRGCDDFDSQVLLTASTDDISQRAIRALESVVPPLDRTSTLPLPKAYRRKFIGKAENIYNIPPLPPCTSSLNAFKMILLDRRNLLKKAGHYYTGGVLGRWRPPTQPKPAPSPAGTPVKMYSPEGLRSSDLTPQRMRKLSIHFAMKDIKLAKQLLEQSEVEQRAKALQDASQAQVDLQSGRSLKRAANRRRVIEKVRQSHDYELLKARFQSVFLWPAMLSTFTVRDVSEEGTTQPPAASTSADSAEMPPPPPKKKRRMAMTATSQQRRAARGGKKKARSSK